MLRNGVARYLTEADPDMGIDADMVTINCKERSDYDLCSKDVSVVISANYSEMRYRKADETADKISSALSDAIKHEGISNYVYLKLLKAGYAERGGK
jgi:hypothetical protein